MTSCLKRIAQVLTLISLLLIKITSSNFQELFIKASSFLCLNIVNFDIPLKSFKSDPGPYNYLAYSAKRLQCNSKAAHAHEREIHYRHQIAFSA